SHDAALPVNRRPLPLGAGVGAGGAAELVWTAVGMPPHAMVERSPKGKRTESNFDKRGPSRRRAEYKLLPAYRSVRVSDPRGSAQFAEVLLLMASRVFRSAGIIRSLWLAMRLHNSAHCIASPTGQCVAPRDWQPPKFFVRSVVKPQMQSGEIQTGEVGSSREGGVKRDLAATGLIDDRAAVELERAQDGLDSGGGLERIHTDRRIKADFCPFAEDCSADAAVCMRGGSLVPNQVAVQAAGHDHAEGVVEAGLTIELAGQNIAREAGDIGGGGAGCAVAAEQALEDATHVGAGRLAGAVGFKLPEVEVLAGRCVDYDQMAVIGAVTAN